MRRLSNGGSLLIMLLVAAPFKNAHVRIQKVGQPDVTEIRTWGAHEHISMRRASAEEGKR